MDGEEKDLFPAAPEEAAPAEQKVLEPLESTEQKFLEPTEQKELVPVNEELPEPVPGEDEAEADDDKTGKKDAKVLPMKKLPALLRKSYSKRGLKSKILGRVSIPSDKALLEELFVEGADEKRPKKFAVPRDRLFSRREITKLRLLSKEMERKGRIMLLPLAIVLGLICAVVFVVSLFKNPLLKKALIAGGETVFGAKTEIGSVDLRILDASLTLNKVTVGNKNEVMKNLFELERVNLDFNLAQALRGKFIAQNLEVSGIALNTDRTTSCELPEKKVPDSATNKEEKESVEDSAFMQSLKEKSSLALDNVKNMAFDMLGGSDVESIVNNLRSQLQTPAMAEKAVADVQTLMEKWKGRPEDIKAQVEGFANEVKGLQNINVKSISDVKSLQSVLEQVNGVIEQSKSLKTTAEGLKDEVIADANSVRSLSDSLANAVAADKDMVQTRLASVVNAVKNARQILSNALSSVAFSMAGKYYPYVNQGLGYAEQLKNNTLFQKAMDISAKNSAEKKKKDGPKRMKGTTFWYVKENPTFLIERAKVSGKNFAANIEEITNDQNVRGKTTKLAGTLMASGIEHLANAVLDVRSGSTEPLISVDYTGDGFKAAVDGSKIAAANGIPSIDGTAKLFLSAAAREDGFSASGTVDLNPVSLTTDGFSSAIVTKYYRQALDTVKSMDITYNFGYTKADGVNLSLDGNFADQFSAAIKSVVASLGNDAKDAALKRINAEINKASNTYLAKTKDFLGIEGDIQVENTKLADIQSLLEKKRAELEAELKARASGAVQSKVEELTGNTEAAKAASSVVDKASDKASGLLKKFGKKD